MGIDGIGKPGGGVPGAGGVAGPGAAGPIRGDSFQVGKAAPAASAAGSEPLGQLQRGEINLDQYLDTRVADAVAHLQGKLPVDQLDFVKQSLREQLATDPVLVELVRRATGSVPADNS